MNITISTGETEASTIVSNLTEVFWMLFRCIAYGTVVDEDEWCSFYYFMEYK
jgi:hypothetical protein